MRIATSDLYSIYIDLGEEFDSAVIKADYERKSTGLDLFIRTMTQVAPSERALSNEEKQNIVKAVLEWNSSAGTISFI